MKRLLFILNMCICFLGSMSAQEAKHYSVQHYSASDGLSQNSVMAMLQDHDGFIWIGTWDGLNRFDGRKFRTYKPSLTSENMSTSRIDFLYEDHLGFIWMRMYDGRFYRLNKHTDQILATTISDTRLGNRIYNSNLLLESQPGIMWLGGDNTLLCIEESAEAGYWDDVKQTTYSLHGEVNFLLTTSNDIWVGTTSSLEQIGTQQQFYRPSNKSQENYFTCGIVDDESLWLGTEAGVVWHYIPHTNHFQRIDLDLHSSITSITLLEGDEMLITSDGDGICIYNHVSDEVQHFHSKNTSLITSDHFTGQPYIDQHHNVWFVNHQLGVWQYQPHNQQLKHYVSEIDERYRNLLEQNFFAFEDSEGVLWLNPFGGGFCSYNREEDCLTSEGLAGCSNMLHTALMDRDGSLWLSTYDLGLDRVDKTPVFYHLYDLREDSFHSGEVRAMAQLSDGEVIASVKAGMVQHFINHDKKISHHVHERVYAILEGNDGKILYGTKGEGILVYEGDQKVQQFKHLDKDRFSLLNDAIYDLLYGSDSTLYIATYGGGINILRDGKFIHAHNEWLSYPNDFGSKVRNITLIDDTTLWAATTSGLLRVNTRTLECQQTPYVDVRCVLKATNGVIWIGTFGGGLIRITNPQAEDVLHDSGTQIFTTRSGLFSDIVLAMEEDNDGGLWFCYEDGITHYNPKSDSFQHFKDLARNENLIFSEAKSLRLQNGNILFGCNKGVFSFNPSQMFMSKGQPDLRFTDFLLFNKSVMVHDDGPLPDNICYAPKVTLRHNESVFTIEYGVLNYAYANNTLYAYRMDGVDDNWNYVENDTRATYTNLSAGTYTFRVRCTNAQGEWADNEQTLTIHVKTSPWLSGWAVMGYLILLLIISAVFYRAFAQNNQLRQEMKIEQKVTDIKLRFFTNISHELRTPLTLIAGPVENILHNEDISPSTRTQLEIVSSNASRMLRLINQILDFRKIQNQKMKLRVQYTDLAQLAQSTFGNFQKEATDKQITYSLINEATDAHAWVDRDKTDTIIYNLLSNAFKFTPAGKNITLRIAEKNDYIKVIVEDTGVGIPKDKRGVLFERFSSNNEIQSYSDKPGTGIGLNLVKELVDLHNGFIEVNSEIGKGTQFTILFHRDKDHFTNDVEFIIDDQNIMKESKDEISQESFEVADPNLKNLLIVDDNEDMRIFLQSILSNYYNVHLANDGQEAIEISQQHPIDLVLTDLMMPNMDGLELTQHLKGSELTSHIPIVLLTAKSAIESRLQALRYGADDYITKPFSPEYLLARIDNIIHQRERLQETYRASFMTLTENIKPNNEKPNEMTPDELFLAHLLEFMEKNMDNNELSVEDLVHEMALGRTVFFNKLKGLTGLSPVEYIRDVRIKRSAELLLDEKYNITEVAYMVGMNDARYFSKCFKTAFGATPTEYRKQNHIG
ncbi:MAG: response regulator [Paludibacteraceae bacterium]|nr:response regulator [Paludibacteraceae bacterium]